MAQWSKIFPGWTIRCSSFSSNSQAKTRTQVQVWYCCDELQTCKYLIFFSQSNGNQSLNLVSNVITWSWFIFQGKIEKALAVEEASSNVEDLVTDGKSHGPSWLIGWQVKSVNVSTPAPTNTYIQELTTQIKRNLEVEFEAKVKKDVQEEVDSKLAWILKKLSEANPSLQINVGDLCATISSDNDNGTPLTSP